MLSQSRSTIMFAVGTTSTQASMRGGGALGGGGGGGGGAGALRLISTASIGCKVEVVPATISALPLRRMRKVANKANRRAPVTAATIHTGTRKRDKFAASACP